MHYNLKRCCKSTGECSLIAPLDGKSSGIFYKEK
nr:MAG TPA: hypothetical protein [Caudoviricetes sp.]